MNLWEGIGRGRHTMVSMYSLSILGLMPLRAVYFVNGVYFVKVYYVLYIIDAYAVLWVFCVLNTSSLPLINMDTHRTALQ